MIKLTKADIESLGFEYWGTRGYHTRNGVEESGFKKLCSDNSCVYIKCFLDRNNKVDSTLDITSTDVFEDETSSPWDGYCEGGCGPSARQALVKNKKSLITLLNILCLSYH